MQSEYRIRREKLLEKMPLNSIAIFFGGSEIRKSADEGYKYQGDYNLYYLTGIKQADSALVLLKAKKSTKSILFIQKYDALKEAWTGIRLKEEEAKNISLVDKVLYIEDFEQELEKIIKQDILTICLDFESAANYGNFDKFASVEEYKKSLKKKFKGLKVLDCSDELKRLRMVKSDFEIEQLRKAIANTNKGLTEVLHTLKPNKYEYEVAALFKYIIALDNNAKLSFNTIAASGKNATILHYPDPKDLLHDHEMILLDLGSDHDEYKADISRTYPISGKYEGKQKEIYEIVLACNKHIIDMVKPGLTIKDLQDETKRFLAKELMALGLIKKEEEISKYYFHNVSHHLGLDTHDISMRELPLEKGNVITVEPGLYIKELGIGVRIEDDVLVTDCGSDCLSKDILKEIKDIELEMRK